MPSPSIRIQPGGILTHNGGGVRALGCGHAAAVGVVAGIGQVIGAVGTTSLAEASMSPHLHFSVTKDGEIIDPQEFLKS